MNKTPVEKRPAEDVLETKVITFLGAENGMFAYQTARLLQAARHDINILVIDNSLSHDLFNMTAGTEDVHTIDRAMVLADRQFTESVFKKFECVIVYLGLTYDQDYIDHSSQIYYLCDYTPKMEVILSGSDLPEDSRSNIVFFNKLSGKIKEEEFLSLVEPGVFEDRENNVFVIDFDERDAYAYIEWLWGTDKALKVMSSDFRAVVSSVVATYFGESVKAVEKVAKSI